MIEGQAGIGKTRLLGEVQRLAEERGFDVYSASGMELEREYAYGVVRQLFEYRAAPPRAARARSAVSRRAGLAESLLLRLGEPARGDGLRPRRPRIAMFAALHGLYWFCAELSERAPLLLAIDDADRADQASLRFLAHLAPRLEGLPVAWPSCWRAGRREPGAGQAELLTRRRAARGRCGFRPPPLSPERLRGSGARAARRRRSTEFFAACHRAAQGNPFLLGELCATLRAEGRRPDGGRGADGRAARTAEHRRTRA